MWRLSQMDPSGWWHEPDKLKHVPHRGLAANNIHHGAFGLGGQSGGGRNLAAATDFFASAVGYAKSFVSNNHEFCFLGDTETRRKA